MIPSGYSRSETFRLQVESLGMDLAGVCTEYSPRHATADKHKQDAAFCQPYSKRGTNRGQDRPSR